MDLLEAGRDVLRLEAGALEAVASRLGPEFVHAVDLLHGCEGRVVVTGVGKSGIIARKIAATLTSTGTPATFLHPVDGLHGDLGIVSRSDVGIFLSKSGATSELHGLLEYMLRLGIPMIAITGQVDSPLGRSARVTLDAGVTEEACPLDLAPTSSTTAALALGDALAMVLLRKKGFRADDFARFHPGGALGRKLTLRVEDVMVSEGYPSLGPDLPMRACIVPLARMRGTIPIVNDDRQVVGVVTAGDLTRLMERDPEGFLDTPVREVMTVDPRVAVFGQLAGAVIHDLETHGIMALPVVTDDRRLQGVVHLHDLLKSGVV
ncbi:MAG: KpsF/GutQ family sugar-phosphate isomerase [Gemmatimonadales bacterium]|nr:MAG: KpsF/GutQ family sugar-phosphate isomerase [Gemmatimonadales bacterium]